MAEFQALRDGMELCNALRVSPVLIESDSSLVVTAIKNTRMENWRFSYVLRECLALFSSDFDISHEFRQKNYLADRLADWAYTHCHKQEFFQVKGPSVDSETEIHKMELWSYRP